MWTLGNLHNSESQQNINLPMGYYSTDNEFCDQIWHTQRSEVHEDSV